MNHACLSVARQCDLLNLSRSTFYYQSCRDERYNYYLMRLIDEEYTRHPFLGYRRMTEWLRRHGEKVNPKRIAGLMQRMGIQGIHPRRKTTLGKSTHKKYPYLLKNLTIHRPNQVWSADITYIRMLRGFMYLVAIMDWYSRYVLSWQLSSTPDHQFCLNALKAALSLNCVEIFNTDQGCQFTCEEFQSCLITQGIRISMDGRGRVFDNIFIERLWRSVKYEEVYLNEYWDPREARMRLDRYFNYYNESRPHQSLEYRTPREVYYGN